MDQEQRIKEIEKRLQPGETERQAVNMLTGLGLDHAARLIAAMLQDLPEPAYADSQAANSAAYCAERYRDGVIDALELLIRAGATDPR